MDDKTYRMLEQAATDSVVNCIGCECEVEPDFDECEECGAANPLRAMGMI